VEFPPDIIAVLAAYTMATLALNLSRYAETIQIVMAVTYLAGLLGILLYIGCFYLSVHMPVIVPVLLLAVAAVLVSFFTEKHMMYRIKKSYSDGGNLS
jgi:heme A synthase